MTNQKLEQGSWGFWLDLVGVVCGAVYCGMSLLAIYIPEEGFTALYWLVVFVNRIACPVLVILVLIPIGLVITRVHPKPIAELVALAGVFISLGAIFFLLNGYEHLDSAKLNGHAYYLGVTSNIRPEQTWMICECEQNGRCHCYSFHYTKSSSSQPARFISNAAKNELKVQVGDEVLYNVLAKCYYADWYPPCSDKSTP